ncbi:M20/M25/M40 family metallo-hydrolase [Paenibacillus larvae]|nr:M20/M25/M40 family metallo-hydrolase [Paenibacillus larvae]MDT2274366.1 M20/M25/M40 family metallo-hydrolase [Paenibacillus larvae]
MDNPPFAPDIRGGRLYARGAIDDKGPAMAAYYGLKLVKKAVFLCPRRSGLSSERTRKTKVYA